MSAQEQSIIDAKQLVSQDLLATIRAYRAWEATGVIPPESALAQARDILLAQYGTSVMVILMHLVGDAAIDVVEKTHNAAMLEALRVQGSNP